MTSTRKASNTPFTARSLNACKTAKADEFYTQMDTIEKELAYYKDELKGKVVYCSCDDPKRSNFFKYFVDHFEELGLKEVIVSHYVNQQTDLFSTEVPHPATYARYAGGGLLSIKPLKGDGSFNSPECLALLDEADVVITNPPFSLFAEFVSLLFAKKKRFLILFNLTNIKNSLNFRHYMNREMQLGFSIHSGGVEFEIPSEYPLSENGVIRNGKQYIQFSNIRWLSSMQTREIVPPMEFTCAYSPERYPKLDNYDAINVNSVTEIPGDYTGVMAVPLTFFDKWCPEQFHILGIPTRGYLPDCHYPNTDYLPQLNGENLFFRVFIQRIV